MRKFFHSVMSHQVLVGLLFMVGSCLAFAAMNVSIRALAGAVHSTEIVFLRNLLCSIFLLPVLAYYWRRDGTEIFHIKQTKLHVWRNLIGIAGMELWYYAITQMPINEATALSFTSPLVATLIAVLFFKETIGIRRIVALLVGFCGVLIILRPSADSGLNPAALIVLLATVFWALASNLVKVLTGHAPTWKIVFIMSVLMTFFSAPLSVMHWHMPSAEEWGILVLVALSALGAHFCLVAALSRADLVTLMPLDFTRLIFTALLAYVFLAEQIDWLTGMGAAVIVSSCFYIAWREKQRKKSTD